MADLKNTNYSFISKVSMLRYIKIENNEIIDYSIEQLLIDHPNAVIYYRTKMPNEKLLAIYNVFPLITEPQPQHEEDETVEEGSPMFKNMEWHQTWNVRKLTQEEVQEVIDTVVLESVDEEEVSLFASTELQQSRLDICKACDSFTEFKTCSESKTIISLKTKLESEACPLDKW